MDSVFNFINSHIGLLLSFLLGSGFTILYTIWRRRDESKKLRILYLNWYLLSKGGIFKQLEYLSEYAEVLKNGHYTNSALNISNLQLDKLLSISDVSLFQAFVFDKKGNTSENSSRLFKMTSNVKYIVTAISDVKVKFEETRLNLKNWQEKWNSLVIEFHEDLATYVFKYQYLYGANVEKIIEIKDTLKMMEPYKIKSYEFIHTVVEPCEKVLLYQLHLEQNDEFLHRLLGKIQRLKILETEKIERLNRTYDLFSNYVSQIKATLESNEGNIGYFSR